MEPTPDEIDLEAKAIAARHGIDWDTWGAVDEVTRNYYRGRAKLHLSRYPKWANS